MYVIESKRYTYLELKLQIAETDDMMASAMNCDKFNGKMAMIYNKYVRI